MSWVYKWWETSEFRLSVEVWHRSHEDYPQGPQDYMQLGVWDRVLFCDPVAVALAEGFVLLDQSINPLLDWALENVHCGGQWHWTEWLWDDEQTITRNRKWLEEVVKVAGGIA